MSDGQKVEITVKAKSKKGTGIMDGNEVWYNASKGVSFAAISKGDKLQVSVVDGAEGGKFVTAFTKTTVAVQPVITPAPKTETTASSGSVTITVPSDKMTKGDWEAKDVRIQKLAVSKDASIITAAMSAMKSEDEVKALFTTLYNHILATVNG